MSAPFHQALTAMTREVGSEAALQLLRTEVKDDGGLVLTLATSEGFRWFAFARQELCELHPRDEMRVPAAGDLSALCDRGEADLLSWRPGRRMVVRLSARDGAHVVKAYRHGRAKTSAQVHAAFQTAIQAASPHGFRLPRVLHADEKGERVAFELLHGDELRFDDLGRFDRIGRALSAMQRSSPEVRLEVHGRAEEVAQLDRHARRFELAVGSLPPGWSEARALLSESAVESPAERVVAHRDLHDGQLLVDGLSIALLDLDSACLAERELDLANLAVHLRLDGWLGLRGAEDQRACAAVDALRAGFGDADDRAERFYTSASALRLALVHGLRPRAHRAIEPLVDLGHTNAAEISRA